MIVFDERERVKELLKNGFKNKTALVDFILLGKYLISEGYSGNGLNNELIKILSDKQDLIPASYLPLIIPKVVKVAKNSPLQDKKVLEITKSEMDIVLSFSSEAQRIAFIYLVCCKFYEKEFSIKPIELKKMADLTKLRNKKLHSLENELFEKGFLKEKETRVDLFYYVDLKTDKDDEVVITILDYNDLIMYYYKYIGVNVLNCCKCNRMFKPNSNSQKYCKECKKIMDKEKVLKYRKKNKNL